MLLRGLCFGFVFAIYALAGEDMWLFNHLPNEQVSKTYGFTVNATEPRP